jgi:hypothetical protein
LVIVGACSGGGSLDTSLETEIKVVAFLPAPKGGTFASPVQLSSTGQILVTYLPPRSESWDVHIFVIDPVTAALTRLPFPDEPDCSRGTRHTNAAELSDGRVAYAASCFGTAARVPFEATRLMAYDPRTGMASPLRPYLLHQTQTSFWFAPDRDIGLVNTATGLRESLLWLLPDRTEPLPLPFERVFGATFSPDGRWVAVAATIGGQGVQGIDRADLPAALYIFSSDFKQQRQLVPPDTGGGGAKWSPDGRWLVATFGVSEERNDLVLVEVATGKTYRIIHGRETGGASFTPDGRRLLVPVGTRSRETIGSPAPGKKPLPEVGLLILELPDLGRFVTAR